MGIIYPCKSCQGRYVGCHSDCQEYKEAKQKQQALKDERDRKKNVDYYIIENTIKNKNRTQKRKQSNRCHYNCNE